MKTTGESSIPKFLFLFFLGHPKGQSTFCDGKVGGSTSMALALQSLVDFYSNVIYKGKRGNCHVQLFNS